MASTSNSGSSLITGSGINTSLTPSSVGVNPSSKGELMLNGALGNAFMGGTTGPNLIGASGAGYGTPDFTSQRNQIKSNMSGGAFFNNEEEGDEELLKKIRQLIEQANAGLTGNAQQGQQPLNYAAQNQQPNTFFGAPQQQGVFKFNTF